MSTDTAVGVDLNSLKRVLEIDEELSRLRDEESRLKKERGTLESLLCEQYALGNVTSMNVDGKTCYLRTDKSASVPAEHRGGMVEWAEREGLEDMIVLQPQRLKSWAKEYIEEHGALPEAIADKVRLYEKVSIRVRSA
ncbi:MAG: hypothetical protein AAGA92_15765 [Planctomycetota bacterium]